MSSPLLVDLIHDVAKSIRISDTETVFERWLNNNPDETKKFPK